MRSLFAQKFNAFDMISVALVIAATNGLGLWWLLLAIPLAAISVAGEEYYTERVK